MELFYLLTLKYKVNEASGALKQLSTPLLVGAVSQTDHWNLQITSNNQQAWSNRRVVLIKNTETSVLKTEDGGFDTLR